MLDIFGLRIDFVKMRTIAGVIIAFKFHDKLKNNKRVLGDGKLKHAAGCCADGLV